MSNFPTPRAATQTERPHPAQPARWPARQPILAGVEMRLLGPLEVSHAGTPISLGPRQQRALLARLLLDANRAVAVDRLVDDLWGVDVPPTAVKMVQVYVSRLRRLLPGDLIATRAPGYVLRIEADAIDLVRFERLSAQARAARAAGAVTDAAALLRAALALWRGPVLAEFDAPFAHAEARRLQELHISCVEDRLDADLALGQHAALVGEIDALVAQHPLRERLRGQLMLALYCCGRQAEALAAYREFRQMLAAELALEPSPALRELERRMLQHDPALGVAALESPARALAEWSSAPLAPEPAGVLRMPARQRAAAWTAARHSRRDACAPHRA